MLRNLVYGNDVGIYLNGNGRGLNVAGNTIYDNNTAGLQIADFANTNGMLIANNLFYQVVADSIRATNSSQILLRNNIFTQVGGNIFNIADNAQSGFSSNYNLIDLRSGGVLGLWGSNAFTSLADWQVLLGHEVNSFTGAISYTDVDGADNLLGQTGATDNGADDDFTILNPQILRDAGDPRTAFYREASGSDGARANIGPGGFAGGGVASPDRTLQILTPNGGDRLRSASGLRRIPFVGTYDQQAGSLPQCRRRRGLWAGKLEQLVQRAPYRTVGNTATYGTAIDLSGVPGTPASVFGTYAYGASNKGALLSFDMDVPTARTRSRSTSPNSTPMRSGRWISTCRGRRSRAISTF